MSGCLLWGSEKLNSVKMCGVFGVITDGACRSNSATIYFFTENHLHRRSGRIFILFFMKLHGSLHPIYVQESFSQFTPFVR